MVKNFFAFWNTQFHSCTKFFLSQNTSKRDTLFHMNKFMQRTPLFSFEEKDHQSYSYIFSLKFNFNQNNFYSRSQAKYFESALFTRMELKRMEESANTVARNVALLNVLRSNIYTVNLISIKLRLISLHIFLSSNSLQPPILNIFPGD